MTALHDFQKPEGPGGPTLRMASRIILVFLLVLSLSSPQSTTRWGGGGVGKGWEEQVGDRKEGRRGWWRGRGWRGWWQVVGGQAVGGKVGVGCRLVNFFYTISTSGWIMLPKRVRILFDNPNMQNICLNDNKQWQWQQNHNNILKIDKYITKWFYDKTHIYV